VILLCDEDIGTKVPRALTLVGYEAKSLVEMGWNTKEDIWWLPKAGELDWLVFSSNKEMLQVPSERQAIIDGNVGIVYLTSGEEFVVDVLSLLLKKWDLLETTFLTVPRPFARFLTPDGKRLTDSYRHYKL
jgi:hypothetical protein